MDNKLKNFLDKINFSYNDEFNDITIDKVVVHKEKKEWDIILNCQKIMNYELFKQLIAKCDEGISGVKKINLSCLIPKINNSNLFDTIKSYFYYTFICK